MVICLSAKGQVEKFFLSGMSGSWYAWDFVVLRRKFGPNFFERNVLKSSL
jgi:hypothetical protein